MSPFFAMRTFVTKLAQQLTMSHNQTVDQINYEVLPHLRINNWMGTRSDLDPILSEERAIEEKYRLARGGDSSFYDYIRAVMNQEVYPLERPSRAGMNGEPDLNVLMKHFPSLYLDGVRNAPLVNLGRLYDAHDLAEYGDRSRETVLHIHPSGKVVLYKRAYECEQVKIGPHLTLRSGMSLEFNYVDGEGDYAIYFNATGNRTTTLHVSSIETLSIGHPRLSVSPTDALWYTDPDGFNAALDSSIEYATEENNLERKFFSVLEHIEEKVKTTGKSLRIRYDRDFISYRLKEDSQDEYEWVVANTSQWSAYKPLHGSSKEATKEVFDRKLSLEDFFLRGLLVLSNEDQEVPVLDRVLNAYNKYF